MQLLAVVAVLVGQTPESPLPIRTSLDGLWEIRQETTEGPGFQPIQVPSAFETVLGVDFDGVARYRRTLPLPAERTQYVSVEFGAVATHARVLVNGHQVHEHLGGWTPFRADLTPHLEWQGDDVLEVIVDERVGHNTQGFLPIIQPHFGGIWQSVTLSCQNHPSLDRNDVFLFGDGRGELTVTAGLVAPDERPTSLRIQVFDGDREVGSQVRVQLGGDHEPLAIPSPRLWRPGTPNLYTVRLSLMVEGQVVDRLERRFGFRSLHAEDTVVQWNGVPLQVRGILHWGYSPPALAPPTDPAFWRAQLEYFLSMGFNTIKCCLWVPPPGFYELCDELGMLVWQEYPTWHPQMDQAHKQELLDEYNEFFRYDRSHPSVAFRSITCETGQGADLDVVTALFEACKAAVPETLVVDDSSWIGWQRITDFWDEHPYGNNSWFPGRVQDFQKHITEKGRKPLLLGECIAADTWVDRPHWLATHGEQDQWWRPNCWEAQAEAEEWLRSQFGDQTVSSLNEIALQFGLDNRRYQMEQLRLAIPEAGYVVSVARDFPKARMGLLDDFNRPKWRPEEWRWHRDTMLCLDHGVQRTVGPGDDVSVSIAVAHFGGQPLTGDLRVASRDGSGHVTLGEPSHMEALEPGPIRGDALTRLGGSARVMFPSLGPRSGRLERIRIEAEVTGADALESQWHMWHYPGNHEVENRGDILEASELTLDLIAKMKAGARVLLRVGDQKGTLRNESMWFLKGAPFAPPHPIHATLPAQCLIETCSFDLESGRVIPWEPWRDQVDPILAFWETHDIDAVRFHLHAFDTNVGEGRLLATTLNLDLPFGQYVADLMRDHLANGPAPERSLHPATIAALEAKLQERTIDLPTWRFRKDEGNAGLEADWQDPKHDASQPEWRDLEAGSHWENQGEDLVHFTGIGWYRVEVVVPEDWRSIDARCVLEGVDDSFHIWLNGELIGVFGDENTKTSIWTETQVAELGRRLRPGMRNTIVLRVVDHAGAGGLWKPVRLTTGPVGAAYDLLR